MSIIPQLVNRRSVGELVTPDSFKVVTEDVVNDVSYNGFPYPAKLPDGRIVMAFKKSINHADGGVVPFCIKHTSARPWKISNIKVGSNTINATALSLGVAPTGRVFLLYNPTGQSTVKTIYTDNLGIDWIDGTTFNFPAGYSRQVFGQPIILPSGKIRQAVYDYPADSAVNPYISRWLDSTDNGATWTVGPTIASQLRKQAGESGDAAVAAGHGIINEVGTCITTVGATDATTKVVAFHRNEEYEGFMMYRSADGGDTWTRVGNWSTNVFATPIANRPVQLIVYNGLVYIFCGNRANGNYGVEYITATPNDVYNLNMAAFSSVVRVYNAYADTLASDVDFGYPEPFIDANGQLCVQFYDCNPNYLISGADWEDVKQIVVIPT